MSQHYSDPSRENDPYALPNVETFFVDYSEAIDMCLDRETHENGHRSLCDECEFHIYGWYWQACFPGCLPDGDPIGPFKTEAEALADAQDGE